MPADSDGPLSDGVFSNHNSADPRENVLEDDDVDNTVTIKYGTTSIFNAIILIVLASDVESIKRAIIKTSKNEAQAPYTILLVGESGVGKSSVLEFIANVFAGNDIGNYNLDILDHTNGLGGPDNQSQTNSARVYEFTSKNGIVVSVGIINVMSMLIILPRFVSSTHLGWPTPAVFGKTSSTRKTLWIRSRRTSTP